MRKRALLLGMLVLLAGCTGSQQESPDESSQDEDQAPPAGSPTTVTRTIVLHGNVSASATGGPIGVNDTATFGTGLAEISMELSWGQGTNRFAAHAVGPGGDETTASRDVSGCCATSAEATVDDPDPGLWRFKVTSEGSTVPDEVRLVVEATWELSANGTGPGSPSPVQTRQMANDWQAWRTYHANGSVLDTVEVLADTVNGPVNLTAGVPDVASTDSIGNQAGPVDDETARARILVVASGDTEERARERVLAVDVTLEIEEDRVEATAEADDWNDTGAAIDVRLPSDTTTSAQLDTTNGPVEALIADADGADLDTTNGPVRGALAGQGELVFDTTNGEIAVEIEPLASATIEADLTNGEIVLGLAESDAIGYTVDADTTNGRLSESMDEASLEGSERDAVLRTQGAQDREIQVDGSADSTNGNIHFEGR